MSSRGRRPLYTPPPGLYPATRPPENPGERTVWHALAKRLPEGWYAWHHQRIGRGASEREGDFVFAIPERGILVLEVKGGRIERRDGSWLAYGDRLDPQPDEQVRRFKYALLRDLKRSGIDLPEITHALCFPDVGCPDRPPEVGGDVVLYEEDLEHFGGGGAERLLEAFAGGFRMPTDTRWIAELHARWGPDWRPTRVFARRPGHVDDVWRQLTTEQEIALECLDESRRIVVDGPPGSGKSLLAMAVADRFADRGQRALVLTYTRAIALEMAAIGVRDARPVRDLALDVALELGLATAHEAETWRTPEWNRMMHAVIDALGDGARRPAWLDVDVVVIDEAQDLGELDWQLVDRIVGERAALWVFQDEEQRVMAHALGVEPPARIRSTARFRLRTTHRCPAPLVGLATRVRDGDASPISQAEIEALRASLTVVRMPRGASEERRRATLDAAVEAGLEQESVGPEDLAIVSLAPARSSRIAAIEALGSRPLRSAVDAPEEGSLLADSVLRLKGLERPIVVLTDLDRVVDHASERVLYLALTRASSQCVLVVAEGDADGHAALREVVARLG